MTARYLKYLFHAGIALLCFFAASIGSAKACTVSAKAADDYIVLEKSKPLAQQLTRKNTTYEVRNSFDLKNASVTIPSGSTLVFAGGNLKNGMVNLNGCYLEGNVAIDCEITGCPSNEHIYTKWFTNKDVELLVLLRNFCSCWYDDKSQVITHKNKRVIHVEKGTYEVNEGIELRYEQDLTIDFSGSSIIDNIDTYDKLRHHAYSAISMRESRRIELRNCNYQMGEKKGKKNGTGAFISLGGPHVSTIQPCFDIKIDNISGESYAAKADDMVAIDILGNCYNVEVSNVDWKGRVSSLVNMEYAIGPITSTEVKKTFGVKEWPYPDYYGLMPYNISVSNVNGYDRPTAKYGYIRTSGAYNVNIQNVYCWNVMEAIELFQGDAGNARGAMNITVSNVCSYWGEEMEKPNYAVSVNITRKNPQSSKPNLENADIAMIRFSDCDFQDNGKGKPEDHYLIRVHGNNGMTVFSNCRMRNSQRAVRIADIINTSLLTHLTKFETCLFDNCTVGLDCQNSIVSVQDCIFNANKNQVNQIKYSIMGLSAETLANYGAMLNAEGNMFRSQGVITSPYVSISSATSLPKNLRLNVSRNIFNNTKSVAAIKTKNVMLDEEKNIGAKVIDK